MAGYYNNNIAASPVSYAANKYNAPKYFNGNPFNANATGVLNLFNGLNKSAEDDYGELLTQKNITKLFPDTLKPEINENYKFSSDTLLKESTAAQGGLQYGNIGTDVSTSALNFSNAYIKAMDKDWFFATDKLDSGELYQGYRKQDSGFGDELDKSMNIFDLSGDKNLDKNELAASILMADTDQDGIVTEKEALALNQAIQDKPEEVQNKLRDIITNNLNGDTSEYAKKEKKFWGLF
ncbi:MAG: hypothetical protein PHC34_02200 [Candidatus Gastranaerophilales bacterium]|nr:hypothetical protein [Candidatus Gastranaerophilales bacterium]